MPVWIIMATDATAVNASATTLKHFFQFCKCYKHYNHLWLYNYCHYIQCYFYCYDKNCCKCYNFLQVQCTGKWNLFFQNKWVGYVYIVNTSNNSNCITPYELQLVLEDPLRMDSVNSHRGLDMLMISTVSWEQTWQPLVVNSLILIKSLFNSMPASICMPSSLSLCL